MVTYRRDPIYRPRVEDFISATPARSIAQGLSSGLLKGVESGFEDAARRKREIDEVMLKSILKKLEGSNVYEVTQVADPIPTVRKYVRDNRIDMPALLESIKTGTPEYRQTVINELRTLDMPDKTIPDIVKSYATKIADKDWHNIVAEPEKVDAEDLLSRLQPLEDMLRDRVAQQPWVQSIDSDEKKKKAQSFLDEFLSDVSEPDATQLLQQQPTEMIPLLRDVVQQKREELTDRLTEGPDTPALNEDIAGLVERLRNVSVNVPPVPVQKRQLSPGEIREYLSEYTSTGKIPKKFENIVIEPATAAGAKSARIYQVTPDGNITDIGPSPTGSHVYKVPLMVRTPSGEYVPKKDDSGALMFVPSTKPEPEYKIEELSAEEQQKRALDKAMQTQLSNTVFGMISADAEKHGNNIAVLQMISELRDTISAMTDSTWEELRQRISSNIAKDSLPGAIRAAVNVILPKIMNLNAQQGIVLQKFGRYAGKIARMFERGVLTDADLTRYVVNPKDFSRKEYLELIGDEFTDNVKKAKSFISSRKTLYQPLKEYTIKDADGNYISYDRIFIDQWDKELKDVTGKHNDTEQSVDTKQPEVTKQPAGTPAPAPTEKKQKPRIK